MISYADFFYFCIWLSFMDLFMHILDFYGLCQFVFIYLMYSFLLYL